MLHWVATQLIFMQALGTRTRNDMLKHSKRYEEQEPRHRQGLIAMALQG
jgi:hypothetical protein